MDRRGFFRLCAGSTALLTSGARLAWADDFTEFPRARLTDAQGAPLKASALGGDDAYVFHYPYRSLPCFLIRLGQAASGIDVAAEWGGYPWPGGVGKDKRVVSYVAVCSHQLAYPDKDSTVIRYSAGATDLTAKPGMIACCAHASVFDPAAGGQRLHGEASEPLAAVRLEHDPSDDGLYATGVAGMPLVKRFFDVHKRHLIETYGAGVYRDPVGATTAAVLLAKYTASVNSC